MKMVKSLILGSAAGLLAMSGAQAADLPVKAKAVEYVKVCSLYGAGFWYIPGTDTCMKIGGYLRVDVTGNGSVYDLPAYSGDLGQKNRYRDYFVARSRMALTVDTRTATEYGVVRTFGQGDFQFDTLGIGTKNPAVLAAPGINNSLLSTPGGGYVAVEFVFIQFAGFTFGKSASAFATPWHGYPGNNTSFLLGGHDTVTGVNNIQYTAQFGNGVSATIGLDDPSVFQRTGVGYINGGVSALGAAPNAYAGARVPDIVGNIRVDQAWGLFQLSGSLHEVNASYNLLTAGAFPTALSEISGNPNAKWGGSVMAALQIKNLPTGPGDDIKIDATYAVGKTKDVISTSAASPSFGIFGGGGGGGFYQSIGFGYTSDAVYVPFGALQLTEAFGVRGAFNHNWNPYWSTSLFGSYTMVRYNATATAALCAGYPGIPVIGSTCNPDFNTAQLGLVTRWTPVKNLTFSAEGQWFHLDQMYTGGAFIAPAAPKPVAFYRFRDQDVFSVNFRVQRNF